MNETAAQNVEARILSEYKTLRDEALLRIRVRGQILTATLVVFGILMTLASHQASNELALLYPIVAVFFAIRWAHIDVRIGEIGEYIRDQIEKELELVGLGWETYIHKKKTKGIHSTSQFVTRPTEIAAIGVFLVAQLLSVFYVIVQGNLSVEAGVLVLIDGAAIWGTAWVLRRRTRYLMSMLRLADQQGEVSPV
jgi:hypothetical protein